jgi:hypothetical protein
MSALFTSSMSSCVSAMSRAVPHAPTTNSKMTDLDRRRAMQVRTMDCCQRSHLPLSTGCNILIY